MKGLSLTSEDELQNLHSVLFDISFICLSILPTFVYARHGFLVPGRSERSSDAQELKLRTVIIMYVGAGY